MTMPNAETSALLRTILEELCADIPPTDSGTRTNVASALLAATREGLSSIDRLREVGLAVLQRPPSMWQ